VNVKGWAATGLAILMVASTVPASGAQDCPPKEARSVSIGPRTWHVEVVANPEDRSRGLSGRASLAPDKAMWFVLPKPGSHGFWMQGMQFAIDLVWVTAQGRVAGMETLTPCAQAPCPISYPPEPVAFVLETRAGEVPKVMDGITWSCQP